MPIKEHHGCGDVLSADEIEKGGLDVGEKASQLPAEIKETKSVKK